MNGEGGEPELVVVGVDGSAESVPALRWTARYATATSARDEGQGSAGAEKYTAYGHPAQALIETSKEADLPVVGRHGRGAFTGMLLGSVSIHCVTGAFCPVVVVRHSNGN